MSHKKAPTIRDFYFRDSGCRDEDYRRAMNEVTEFSFTSKNLHDDSPDNLAMLADCLNNGMKSVSVAKRLF